METSKFSLRVVRFKPFYTSLVKILFSSPHQVISAKSEISSNSICTYYHFSSGLSLVQSREAQKSTSCRLVDGISCTGVAGQIWQPDASSSLWWFMTSSFVNFWKYRGPYEFHVISKWLNNDFSSHRGHTCSAWGCSCPLMNIPVSRLLWAPSQSTLSSPITVLNVPSISLKSSSEADWWR